jgi:hypothetical protein
MRSDNDELWKQTAKLLRRRPGWVVEAVSTPGMQTYWCFGRGGRAELTVQVEHGALNLRLGDGGEIITLHGVSELVTWLTANRPGSLQPPKKTIADRLKAGKLFRWE